MRKVVTFIVFLCTCSLVHSQSGWTRESGKLYSQASISFLSASNYYNTEGILLNSEATFQSRGLLIYAEYGFSDNWTMILDAPILLLQNFKTSKIVSGVGGIKLGLKRKILQSFPLSLQVDLDIPTDDGLNLSRSKQPNELGFFDEINLPTSDGEFNVWTTIASSFSFKKTYSSLYSGVNLRTESFSHQLYAGGEIGRTFWDKVIFGVKIRVQERLSTKENFANASFLYGEGTTFTSLSSFSMIKVTQKWRVILGYEIYSDLIIQRRNIYSGPRFSVGIAYEN